MNDLLVLSKFSEAAVSLAPDAHALRASALEDARSIGAVADPFDAEVAAASMRKLKELSKSVEDARTAVKAPVLKLTRDIDGVAKDFCADLDREYRRLGTLLGEYQRRVDEKRREEERQAQIKAEELRRAEIEAAQEAERKAEAEAEVLRQKARAEAETARAEAVAAGKDPEAAVTAVLESADRRIEDVLARSDDAYAEVGQKIAQTTAEIIGSAPVKPRGTSITVRLKFEVTDIAALYAARPDCVALEPRKALINELIKQDRNIPGLRVWEETTASMR